LLAEHLRGIAVKAVDHGAGRTANLCGCGKQLSPRGARRAATTRQVNLIPLELIERIRQPAESAVFLAGDVVDDHWHRAACQGHVRVQRSNRGRQELIRTPDLIEHVSNNRRPQPNGSH
jgi:hypothetical protein